MALSSKLNVKIESFVNLVKIAFFYETKTLIWCFRIIPCTFPGLWGPSREAILPARKCNCRILFDFFFRILFDLPNLVGIQERGEGRVQHYSVPAMYHTYFCTCYNIHISGLMMKYLMMKYLRYLPYLYLWTDDDVL